MDFEDHFTSHEYCNVFWKSFEIYVEQVLPLKSTRDTDSRENEMNSDPIAGLEGKTEDEGEIDVQDEVGIDMNLSGEIVPKNGQVLDYMCRGSKLEQISLWEYVA